MAGIHDDGVERLAAVLHGMVGLDEPTAVLWALRLGLELQVVRGPQAVVELDGPVGRLTVVVVDGVVVEAFPG